MKINIVFLTIFCTLAWVNSVSATPAIQKRLREMLDIPASQKGMVSLTLKEVSLAAMARSDSFQALMAKSYSLKSDEYLQDSLTDSFFVAHAKQDWNRNQANSIFGTTRFDQTVIDLGFEKRFFTGTKLGLGLSEYRNTSVFGGNFGTVDAKVAAVNLEIAQSLWRDSFGSSTRNLLNSGKLKSEAKKIALEAEIEDWFLQFSSLYYQVWLTQRRVEATQLSLERKERLASLFQRRKQLGISEEADQIQISSAVDQTRVQLDELKRSLAKNWNLLVVSLKLSPEDQKFNPMDIPMEVGDAQSFQQLGCDQIPDSNRALKQIELESKAIALQMDAALDRLRPDLVLTLGASTNRSILNSGDEFGTRWSDAFAAKYPAYSIGLLFKIPLSASLEKSESLQLVSANQQLQSRASQLKDQLQIDFESHCSEVKMLEQHDRLYQQVETNLKRRIGLEENRYRQARIQPFTVLQAGDELFGTSVAKFSNLGNWWEKRWNLEKSRGQLFEQLDTWVKDKTGKTIFEKLESGRML
jgi:outer membrane protein TolC